MTQKETTVSDATVLKQGIYFDSWTSTEAIQMNPRQRTTHVLVLKNSIFLLNEEDCSGMCELTNAFELVSSDGLLDLPFS
jgi:hypothetical protein